MLILPKIHIHVHINTYRVILVRIIISISYFSRNEYWFEYWYISICISNNVLHSIYIFIISILAVALFETYCYLRATVPLTCPLRFPSILKVQRDTLEGSLGRSIKRRGVNWSDLTVRYVEICTAFGVIREASQSSMSLQLRSPPLLPWLRGSAASRCEMIMPASSVLRMVDA